MRTKLEEDVRSRIELELEQILASDSFCHSRQSDRLLRYLVKHTLDNREEMLRERVIGVEVFKRDPGYDTNEESIVRVRVNELRKRLAKYYQDAPQPAAVRFSIPSGSYRVGFQQASETAAATVRTEIAAEPSALELFWRPALLSPRPVVICSPHPVVYRFTRDFYERATGEEGSHIQAQTAPLELDPEFGLQWRDVVAVPDQYIGIGSAHAIASVSAFLAARQKPSVTRFGNDISFEDLRTAPAVLVGAYSNHWTLDMNSEWRFVFAERNGLPVIQDRSTGREWSPAKLKPNGRTNEDFAIVTRAFHSRTGELLITAAGVTQYGSRSAGEVVVSATLLDRALREFGPAWPEKNVQVLLHAPVIGHVPGSPEILAVHVW